MVKPGFVLTTIMPLETRPLEVFVMKRRPYIVLSVRLAIRRVKLLLKNGIITPLVANVVVSKFEATEKFPLLTGGIATI